MLGNELIIRFWKVGEVYGVVYGEFDGEVELCWFLSRYWVVFYECYFGIVIRFKSLS